MTYLWVFLVGGTLCIIAQIIVDNTKYVAGQILVMYIVGGVVLTALGLYEPLVELAGSGATVPLTGFGYALVKGTFSAIDEQGFIGIFTGGLTATSAGICAALVFGYLASAVAKPRTKN